MEFLIKADEPSRGGFIFHKNDGAGWSPIECLPKFLVVRIDTTKEPTFTYDQNKKFDIDSAFSEVEMANIQSSDWLVLTKSTIFIVDK